MHSSQSHTKTRTPDRTETDDTPVELQLLQCVRLHLQADVQRVTEMLQDTKYSHLGQESESLG
jgi:hypothetical protein